MVASSLSEGRQRRAGSLELNQATKGNNALEKVGSGMVHGARAVGLMVRKCGGTARLLVAMAGRTTRRQGRVSQLTRATFRKAGTGAMLPTWHGNRVHRTISRRRAAEAKADHEQTGPKKGSKDWSRVGGKAVKGKHSEIDSESDRVERGEQEGNRDQSNQPEQPRDQQREELVKCL